MLRSKLNPIISNYAFQHSFHVIQKPEKKKQSIGFLNALN